MNDPAICPDFRRDLRPASPSSAAGLAGIAAAAAAGARSAASNCSSRPPPGRSRRLFRDRPSRPTRRSLPTSGHGLLHQPHRPLPPRRGLADCFQRMPTLHFFAPDGRRSDFRGTAGCRSRCTCCPPCWRRSTSDARRPLRHSPGAGAAGRLRRRGRTSTCRSGGGCRRRAIAADHRAVLGDRSFSAPGRNALTGPRCSAARKAFVDGFLAAPTTPTRFACRG